MSRAVSCTLFVMSRPQPHRFVCVILALFVCELDKAICPKHSTTIHSVRDQGMFPISESNILPPIANGCHLDEYFYEVWNLFLHPIVKWQSWFEMLLLQWHLLPMRLENAPFFLGCCTEATTVCCLRLWKVSWQKVRTRASGPSMAILCEPPLLGQVLFLGFCCLLPLMSLKSWHRLQPAHWTSTLSFPRWAQYFSGTPWNQVFYWCGIDILSSRSYSHRWYL